MSLSHHIHSLPRVLRSLLRARLTALLLLLPLHPVSAAELNISQIQLPIMLGQYLDHYEDPGRELGIEQILDPALPWRRSVQDIPTMGLTSSAHWFYLTLRADQLQDEDLVLSLTSANLDRLDYYFVRDNQVMSHTAAGDTVPFGELLQPYRFPVVPFTMNADGRETRIYIRAFSQSGVEMPLALTTMELLLLEQQGQFTFFGAFFTFFFVCLLVCSCLFYFLRDKQFLGFTLFFGGTIAFFLAQTGMGRVLFWGASGHFNNRMTYVAATILISSFCLLGQALHLTSRYRDQIIIVLRFVSYAMALAALYFLLIPFEQISSENVFLLIFMGLLVVFTVMIMTAVTAFQGSRTAIYLLASWILVILAYASLVAYKLNLIQRSEITPIFGEYMTLLAALMLLLSLGEFVRLKNEELAQARRETRAKGDFLRNVSREFLTPVHLILSNSKRLLASRSEQLDEDTRQHMSTVIKQSDHLHNLINDLLEMAELESDSFEPEFELVDMSQFLTEIRNMMLPTAMEKGLDLKAEFSSANLLVQTDKSRLQHALVNVITNAIKYTEHGDIVLGYRAVYFHRRLGVEISIKDSGRGMSPEFQQLLFQEFSREQPDSEKDPEGTGLGLVIVKRMLEKLGGEISFESEENSGSEFFIRLPLRVNVS